MLMLFNVIYGHPVIAATRALRFSDHVTKRNGGSGNENGAEGQCADAAEQSFLSAIPGQQ